jgi:tetratricopeptide (TPR) repeat protein
MARRGVLRTLDLWSEHTGYDLWRYALLRELGARTLENQARPTEDFLAFGAEVANAGLPELACLAVAVGVLSAIDVEKDATKARRIAEEHNVTFASIADRRVRAFWLSCCADACRCSQSSALAVPLYQKAMELLLEEPDLPELAGCQLRAGISYADTGQYNLAFESIRRAAATFQRTGIPTYARAQGECYLELAVVAARGKQERNAVAALIAAKIVFSKADDLRGLGMVAGLGFALAELGAPAGMPRVGYTLGFPQQIPGMEGMSAAAPSLAVALAAHANGLDRQACRLFEQAYKLAGENAERQSLAASLAVAPATKLGLHELAHWGARVCSLPPPLAPGYTGPPPSSEVADRILNLAVNELSSPAGSAALASALSRWRAVTSTRETTWTNLVDQSLAALLDSKSSGLASPIEAAYAACMKTRAYSLARWLAIYRAFVFPVGRKENLEDLVLWQWRAGFLVLEPSAGSRFADYVMNHSRGAWLHLKEAALSLVPGLLKAVEAEGLTCEILVRALFTELAGRASPQRLVGESVDAAAAGVSFDGMRVHVSRAFLDLAFSPNGPRYHGFLQDMSSRLQSAQQSIPDAMENTAWSATIAPLSKVSDVARGRRLDDGEMTALLGVYQETAALSPLSAANYRLYVSAFCSHLLIMGGGKADLVRAILSRASIERFIASTPKLPRQVQLRLLLSAADAEALTAIGQAERARMLLHVQDQLHGAFTDLARRSAAEDLRKQASRIEDCRQWLYRLADDCRAMSDDELICLSYWTIGQFHCRVATQATRLITGEGPAAGELREAHSAFQIAYDTAVKAGDEASAGRAACELATTSRDLGDEAGYERFLSSAREHAGKARDGRLDELVEFTAKSETLAQNMRRLIQERRADRAEPGEEFSESDVQSLADKTITAMGIPIARRPHVVDDIRKTGLLHREQRTFCRHIEGLQNLSHVRSYETCYASRTRYVGACTLHRYRTVVEHEDLQAVLDGMKGAYCRECRDRSPGAQGAAASGSSPPPRWGPPSGRSQATRPLPGSTSFRARRRLALNSLLARISAISNSSARPRSSMNLSVAVSMKFESGRLSRSAIVRNSR